MDDDALMEPFDRALQRGRDIEIDYLKLLRHSRAMFRLLSGAVTPTAAQRHEIMCGAEDAIRRAEERFGL